VADETGNPINTPEDAIREHATYAKRLIVKVRVHNSETGEIVEKEHVLGKRIPWMTDSGDFIVNGSRRVTLNQLVRSPGIYLKLMVLLGEFLSYPKGELGSILSMMVRIH